MTLRPDLSIIAANVARGSRVLDVGCGEGTLMAALRDERGIDARGLELDGAKVAAAVARGLAEQGKAVVWIDGGLHANETVGAHQLIETVWQLASRDDAETRRMVAAV